MGHPYQWVFCKLTDEAGFVPFPTEGLIFEVTPRVDQNLFLLLREGQNQTKQMRTKKKNYFDRLFLYKPYPDDEDRAQRSRVLEIQKSPWWLPQKDLA